MIKLIYIFRIMFNRYGFFAFLLCFAAVFIVYFPGLPTVIVKPLMVAVKPYLLAILQMGVLINSTAVVLMLLLVIKVICKKNYTIKNSVLSLLLAFFLLEWLSLVCFMMYPKFSSLTADMYQYYQVYATYRVDILEAIGLVCTIYLVAFYVGALSRKKFKVNIVLLGKIKKSI